MSTRKEDLGIVWKKAIRPEDSTQGWFFCHGPYTNFGHREWREHGMHIEKDVAVPTRHGTLYANIFRPDSLDPEVKLPVIVAISPYGKHASPQFPCMGVTADMLSHYSIGEAPDPGHWIPHGYAVVCVDTLGSWHSEGDYISFGSDEAEAGADAVDWIGSRSWCNGSVALAGASYYSMITYRVAAKHPRHLKALVPWEGGIRVYDGFINHGGIPSSSTSFLPHWSERWCSYGQGLMEDLTATNDQHPNFDSFWADKTPDLSSISIPIFTSSGWAVTESGLHLAGTFDAWRSVSSQHKWLIGWPFGHQYRWYQPEMRELQREFYDHFLNGIGEVPKWPRVQIASRVSRDEDLPLRGAHDFPLPDTQYVKMYLDGSKASLVPSPPTAGQCSYDATTRGVCANFDLRFEKETVLTGYMCLHLWLQIDVGDEADLFVMVQKLDQSGKIMALGPVSEPIVPRAAPMTAIDLPITRGWLRASYRELDPVTATHFQPRHTYRYRQPLVPREPLAVDVELWPTSVTLRPGEGLRLLISGKDIIDLSQPLAHNDSNAGQHILLFGGDHDSHLVLPVV